MRKNLLLWGTIALLIALSAGFFFIYFGAHGGSTPLSQDQLVVVYDDLPDNIDPYSLRGNQRVLKGNVFEGLTAVDRFYRPTRALALSWGNLSDTKWEFTLRKDVYFHDGSTFTADDVIRAFDEIKKRHDPELDTLLESIKSVVKTDTYTVQIETKDVDPLLLSRLSLVPISKKVISEGVETYIGTGPYQIRRHSNNEIILTYFSDYWDEFPTFKQITMREITDKYDRFIGLMQGNIDILASVPASQDNVDAINKSQIVDLFSVPSLELIYLMFNSAPTFNGAPNPLADKQIRRAVSLALNTKDLASFAEGFATPINQYIASGIFGYNPDLPEKEYSVDAAQRILGRQRLELNLTITKDFRILAEYIKTQLASLQINVVIDVVETPEEFLQRLRDGTVQAYILGWRFDLGDSHDFLKTHIHTKAGTAGQYNASGFSNKKVDGLIDLAEHELDETTRLSYLQEVQRIIMEEFIGVPLFETKTIMAKRKVLDYQPRLDGNLIFSEVHIK